MNAAGGDVLLVVGDTAVADGDALERRLSRFHFPGPKLFVAGNHELWTHGTDSYQLFTEGLPRRVAASAGTGWKRSRSSGTAWRSWARSAGTTTRSPRVAGHPAPVLRAQSLAGGGRAAAGVRRTCSRPATTSPLRHARWSRGGTTGSSSSLHRGDEDFLAEHVERLESQLADLAAVPEVVVARPPPPVPGASAAGAGGALGLRQGVSSEAVASGRCCSGSPTSAGSSAATAISPPSAGGGVHAVNVGSGYRLKTFLRVDVPS